MIIKSVPEEMNIFDLVNNGKKEFGHHLQDKYIIILILTKLIAI